jgi:hypothetical protein
MWAAGESLLDFEPGHRQRPARHAAATTQAATSPENTMGAVKK